MNKDNRLKLFLQSEECIYKRQRVIPAGIYLLKVNNRNTRKRCEMCLKLIIKTPEQRQWLTLNLFHTVFKCFYCNFEHVMAGWVYKDITMERNNRKKYIHIDPETGSNEIFAMLDKIKSATESDIENLLEDSDTECIAVEPIPNNIEGSHQLLTPEATVHVEGEVLDIDVPPAKKT